MKVRSVTPGQGGGAAGAPPGSHSAGRQAVRVSIPTRRSKSRAGAMQKLAWLTGPGGGVGPGQSRTPWMFCEQLL